MSDRKCEMCGATDAEFWYDVAAFCGPCSEAFDDASNTRAIDDVIVERLRQDKKWGGVWADYSVLDLHDLLRRLAVGAERDTRAGDNIGVRERLVEIAAFALGAVEALDRALHEEQEAAK